MTTKVRNITTRNAGILSEKKTAGCVYKNK